LSSSFSPSVSTTTELILPGSQPALTVRYAASTVSYSPVSPFRFGVSWAVAAVMAARLLDSGPIGVSCLWSTLPTILVENAHRPTAHESSKSWSPRLAASTVTWARVAPPADGTFSSMEPDTSMTASIRAGRVIAFQVASARSIAATFWATFWAPPPPSPAAADGVPAGFGAPVGVANPLPPTPSGPRRPCPASRSRKEEVSSAARRPAAAAALAGSMPGRTAIG
jgi:hypothetical protein